VLHVAQRIMKRAGIRKTRQNISELIAGVHRNAERLLLVMDTIAWRAADALHLALASLSGAAAIVTYDLRMAEAAIKIGLDSLP
jgi:predicted nucleic acid-binding protein